MFEKKTGIITKNNKDDWTISERTWWRRGRDIVFTLEGAFTRAKGMSFQR